MVSIRLFSPHLQSRAKGAGNRQVSLFFSGGGRRRREWYWREVGFGVGKEEILELDFFFFLMSEGMNKRMGR